MTSRRAVAPDAEPSPPPCPPPQLGRRGPHVRNEPASPVYRYTGSAGRQESGGAPHCPKRPPPTPAVARGLAAPGGLLCRGGEATGRFIPAPNRGLCPRHRAQTPVGGYHTTTHHRNTDTRER